MLVGDACFVRDVKEAGGKFLGISTCGCIYCAGCCGVVVKGFIRDAEEIRGVMDIRRTGLSSDSMGFGSRLAGI